MPDREVLERLDVLEVIDRGRTAALHRESLRLPGNSADPPLAVERTVRVGGPTREVVILVHGFCQNRYTWRLSGRSLSGALAEAGYDVWNLELRGHGNSRALGAGNARDFSEYVDDCVRAVRACGGKPFLLGHSLGGAVIAAAATEVPVAGVVPIAGVFTFRNNVAIRAFARLSLRSERQLLRSPLRFSTGWAGKILGRLYSVTDLAGYGSPLAGWAPGSIERDLLEERLRLGFDWTSVEVWLQMCRWAAGEPFQWADSFSALDVPLLVICGDMDPLLPEADARACYDASRSRDRTFWCFDAYEHGVHWGHLDLLIGKAAPVEVWPRLLAWMAERSRVGTQAASGS